MTAWHLQREDGGDGWRSQRSWVHLAKSHQISSDLFIHRILWGFDLFFKLLNFPASCFSYCAFLKSIETSRAILSVSFCSRYLSDSNCSLESCFACSTSGCHNYLHPVRKFKECSAIPGHCRFLLVARRLPSCFYCSMTNDSTERMYVLLHIKVCDCNLFNVYRISSVIWE